MAIASGGTLGTGAEGNSADTSFTMSTATNTLAANDIGLLVIVTDNIATTDSDSSTHTSVTGGTGTWTKLGERTNTVGGAAGDGVCTSIWMLQATGAVNTGTTITMNLSGNASEKCCSFWKFTVAANRTLALTGMGITNPVNNGTDASNGYGSVAFSGLPSFSRLYFRGLGKEANSTTDITVSGSFTAISVARSRNNVGAVFVRGEWRINTSTGETSNPTLAVSGDTAAVFVALEEVPFATESLRVDAGEEEAVLPSVAPADSLAVQASEYGWPFVRADVLETVAAVLQDLAFQQLPSAPLSDITAIESLCAAVSDFSYSRYTDDFNRADAGSLGADWPNGSGFGISGNEAAGNGGGTNLAVWRSEVLGQGQWAQVTARSWALGIGSIGPGVRVQTNGAGYYAVLGSIKKWDGTTLAGVSGGGFVAYSVVTGDVIRLEANGDMLSLYQNDVFVGSTFDGAASEKYQYGSLGLFAALPTDTLDNWSGGSLGSAGIKAIFDKPESVTAATSENAAISLVLNAADSIAALLAEVSQYDAVSLGGFRSILDIWVGGVSANAGGATLITATDSLAAQVAEIVALYVRVDVADSPGVVGSDTTDIRVSADVTDSLAVVLADTAFVLAAFEAAESLAAQVAEAFALLVYVGPTDSNGIAASDTTDVRVSADVSESTAVQVSDTVTIYVTLDAVDALAVVLAEFAEIATEAVVAITAVDSLAVQLTEVTALLVYVTPTDEPSVGISDSTAIYVYTDNPDTTGVTVAEPVDLRVSVTPVESLAAVLADTATIAALIAASETVFAQLGEVTAVLVYVAPTDAPTTGISDSTDIRVRADVSETLASIISDSAVIFATLNAFDSLAVVLSEFAVIATETAFAVSAADSLAIQVAEATTLLVYVTPADDAITRVTETVDLSATLAVAESLAVIVTEAASQSIADIQFFLNAADSLAIALDEQATLRVTVDITEATGVTASDAATIVATLAVAESLGLRISEVTALLILMFAADSAAAQASERIDVRVSADVTDALPIGASESALVSVTVDAIDATTIALSDMAALLVSLAAAESIALAADDVGHLTWLMHAADEIALACTEGAESLIAQFTPGVTSHKNEAFGPRRRASDPSPWVVPPKKQWKW